MAQSFWEPDFCPPGRPCKVEVSPSFVFVAFHYCCAHHQSLRDDGMPDTEVVGVMLDSCRVKEAVREEIRKELEIGPEVSFRVEASGDIVVRTGETGSRHDAAKARAEARAATIERRVGTSRVLIE